jgi:CubicO group peptidase (beta-lactamase class C family)
LSVECGTCQQDPAISAETQQHIENVKSGLLPDVVWKNDPHPGHSLSDRMAALHVPGVSIAVIHHGVIEWAQGFGVTRLGGPPVTAKTMFQAGSISKPVSALAALRLVQEGKLTLDADVNTELSSWKLPIEPFTENKPVTLRQLLSHTGGITVHGFDGYASGAPVPSLIQVLDGVSPANSPAIRSEALPGSGWKYSGGGYTILQQVLTDVTGEPFPKLLQDFVLTPIGMTESTYQQPLPGDRKLLAATPYNANGTPVAGGPHTYPEMAAAGLWTTPTDLARYAIEVQHSLVGKSNLVLSAQMTRHMLTPGQGGWGLGPEIHGSATDPLFLHRGVDAGFECLMVAYVKRDEGAVVMTNAQGGGVLAAEVMRSIAAEYKWPHYYRPEILGRSRVYLKVLVVLLVAIGIGIFLKRVRRRASVPEQSA